MAHELEILNGQASFVSHREPAWHQLGTIVDNAMTAQEALTLGGLDWQVKMTPATVQIAGQLVSVPERMVTYRDDPLTGAPVPLGVVGSYYRPIQNADAFDLLDDIVDQSGANYETAGVLRNGSLVFMTMAMPEGTKVGGTDPIGLYLSAVTSHDGTTACQVIVTPVRIVCANTARMALTSAPSIMKIRHSASAPARIAEARLVLGITTRYMDEWSDIANRLADIDMTNTEVDSFLAEMWPDGDSKNSATRSENIRSEVSAIYHTAETQQTIKGNAWGAYNAVTEYFDHFRPIRHTAKSGPLSDSLLRADAMFSDSLTSKKDRAAKLLLAHR